MLHRSPRFIGLSLRTLASLALVACSESPNDSSTIEDGGSPGDAATDTPVLPTLECPTGAPLELTSGSHRLTGQCAVTSVSLAGDASLLVEDASFTAAGNIELRDDAALDIRGGSLTIAQKRPDELEIRASGNASLSMRGVDLSTRAADASGNAFISYYGEGNSTLTVEDTEIDHLESWVLATLSGSATVKTKNSAHVPSEIYPSDSANVRIEGAKSEHGVWLMFPPHSVATLNDIPGGDRFTYSFGRNTPGVVGVDYQVDVVDGVAGFNVLSTPHSDVSVKDNGRSITIGYMLAGTIAPESLSSLPMGTVTTVLTHQGRRLALENVTLGPVAWQIYVDNAGVTPEVVTISSSVINELGALQNAKVNVEKSTFQWALVAAIGKGSTVSIADSVLNSQTVSAAEDAMVTIQGSSIFGSLVHATGSSRIVIVNTEFHPNACHGACSPFCDEGSVCNPFNPAKSVELSAEDQAAILVLGIDPFASPIAPGTKAPITGTALIESLDEKLTKYAYRLSYRAETATTWTELLASGPAPKSKEPLGTLDTSLLASGGYVMRLELLIGGMSALVAERPFAIAP